MRRWEWVGGAFGQGEWEGHGWEGRSGEVDGRDMWERWTTRGLWVKCPGKVCGISFWEIWLGEMG